MDLGSAGRGPKTKKPSVPKAWRDLRKSSKKALKLFSSFLRGASCPKSPRLSAKNANGTPRNCIFYPTDRLSCQVEHLHCRDSVDSVGPSFPIVCVTTTTNRPSAASNTHQHAAS